MKSPQRLFMTVCLLLVLASFAGAQVRKPGDPLPPSKPVAGSQEPQDQFGLTVNVSVVNVDVYVTDKKGKVVTGLTKDDFQLFENKKPVEITNFYAINGGKPVTPPPAQTAAVPVAPRAAGTPPSLPPELDRVQTPEDQRLRLVIYIDNFNLHPFNRNRVIRELRAFIGQKLSRDDQLMLVTYDRELHVRRTFTSDPGLIAAAMTEQEKVSGMAVHADSERKDALRNIDDSRSVAEAEGYARSYAQSTYNDLSFSIDALKKMVDALAGVPGRKAVVYVSDGLQMIAGQDVFYAVQNKYGEQSTSLTQTLEFDTSRRFEELTAQANANRISFYAIDAAGLRAYESNSAENAGGPPTAGFTQLIDGIRIFNLQSPLQLLAERTGGQVILNSNQITPHLGPWLDDFKTFYSLGYTPTHYGDGRYYHVEVKVKGRKDLQVRHREGYRDKSTDARMNDGTMAALNFPVESNPLGVSLEFGEVQPRPDGFFLVSVSVRIPIGKLVLVPREKSEDARVRVFIAAMDGNGGVTPSVQQVPVPISVPKADVAKAQNQQYVYSVTLLMRGGDQRVAVGVRDDVAAQESFVSRGVRVGR